jgi:hypothetical protein
MLTLDMKFPSHISQLAVKDTSNAGLICARMVNIRKTVWITD